MFKPVTVAASQFRDPSKTADEAGVKRVFMVLHGYYGNLFLSKFSTGIVKNGEDEGISNARRIWAYGLREFDGETVKAALRQCQDRHPEYPPSLPQFVALCSANRSRDVFRPTQPQIGMSQELRSRYAAQARAINARHAAKQVARATGYREVPTGLMGLAQAIADAIACAGGDEAQTLTRLERHFQGTSA
jgi:hypothetical protein